MTETINIVGVATKQHIYISNYSPGYNTYISAYNNLGNYKINGEIPTQSFDKFWSIISSEPITVEKLVPSARINERYELKNKDLQSDKIPLTIPKYQVEFDDDYTVCGEYADIISLYDLVYDYSEAYYEKVDFTYQTLLVVDDINIPENIVFTKNANYLPLAQILYPPIVASNYPCSLTVRESYDIIRQYVKLNINPKYAKITSDYDFCFTVKKIIELPTVKEYKIDVNAFSSRKKKPKYETRYRTTNEIEVFEMAPAAYQNYTIIKPFVGKNQKDLELTIKKYLDDLMNKINEPLRYCKHCNGTGVILNDK